MSLTIGWLDEAKEKGIDYYADVEALFPRVVLQDTPEVRRVLDLIEKAKYNDKASFIDRFGYKVFIRNLSTGCKAALILLLCDLDKPLSLLEVGNGAYSVILSVCKKNSVLLRREFSGFTEQVSKIDVMFDGKHFDDADLLWYYIDNGGVVF